MLWRPEPDPLRKRNADRLSHEQGYPAVVGFLHGAALCHRTGISIETYARDLVLPVLKGPTLTSMLEHLTRACLARRYDENLQATLNIWNAASSVRDFASHR